VTQPQICAKSKRLFGDLVRESGRITVSEIPFRAV